MIITGIEPFIVHVPLPDQISDSVNSITHWGFVGVVLRADNGLCGYGFTGTHAFLPGDQQIASYIHKIYGPLLMSQELQDRASIERVWRQLHGTPPLQWIGRAGISQLALAAVDIALWDLLAKLNQVPLWKLLHQNGTPADLAAYDTNVGWLNIPLDRVIAGCLKSIDAGFGGVKIKVGSKEVGKDIERVEAVRRAIGPNIKLMIDANGRWDLGTAVLVTSRLMPCNLFWIEEPLYFDDLDSHVALSKAVAAPIALGEQLYSRFHFESFMSSGAVEFVQVDALRVAGVTEWLMVADRAHEIGLPVVPHVGDMMQVHQHTAFGHPACNMLEYIPWTQHCFEDPATVRDGRFVLPTKPGAGSTFEPAAFAQFSRPLA